MSQLNTKQPEAKKRDVVAIVENAITNICDSKHDKIMGVALISRLQDSSGIMTLCLVDSREHEEIQTPQNSLPLKDVLLKVVCRTDMLEIVKTSKRSDEFVKEFHLEVGRLDKSFANMSAYNAQRAFAHPIPLMQNIKPEKEVRAALASFTRGDNLDEAINYAVDTMVGMGIFTPHIGTPKAFTESGGLSWRINEQAYMRTQEEIDTILADPDIRVESSQIDVRGIIQKYLGATTANAIVERDGSLVKMFTDDKQGRIFAALVRHRLGSWRFGAINQIELEPNNGV
ncbi:MAG: hypothetical protein ACREBF_03495 [Candidatus Micrarchaeales archaeon]